MRRSFYFLTALAAVSLVFAATGCDTVSSVLGPGAGTANPDKLRVRLHSGACYGRCEVYGLELYENGLLLFQGERFTDKPGVWEKNIDRRRMLSLLDSFERADFENYPISFRSQIPDLPSTEITWYAADRTAYRTSFKEYAPPELEQLALQLQRLARSDGWRQVSETIPTAEAPQVANAAREEIIVQLADGVRAEAWIVAYGKQNAQLVRRLSPTSNYYLITADPNLMAADELLEYLRRDESVLGAQRNTQVEGRE